VHQQGFVRLDKDSRQDKSMVEVQMISNKCIYVVSTDYGHVSGNAYHMHMGL
jgi:hypothetical protein